MAKLDIDKIHPLPPNVLVRRLPPKSATQFIILPDAQNWKNRTVEVLRVHGGIKHKNGAVTPASVKPGDLCELIVFDGEVLDKYEETDIEWCREENILAVWEK